jgi:hypothetical protein
MKKKQPLAPWLPGRLGRMTRKELDAESDQYDVEFSAARLPRVANATTHPRKRGRPRMPAGQRSARVLITLPPALLAEADSAGGRQGLTRAALIRRAVLDWLAREGGRRKSG